jgi:hypothetical protein
MNIYELSKKLQLPYCRDNHEEIIKEANKIKPGYEKFLIDFLEREYQKRYRSEAWRREISREKISLRF